MQSTRSHRPYPPMHYRRQSGRFLWPLVWLLLVIYVINNPAEAAAGVRALIGWLEAGTEALFSFAEAVGRTQ